MFDKPADRVGLEPTMGFRLDINSVAPATNSATCQHIYRTNIGAGCRPRSDSFSGKNRVLCPLELTQQNFGQASGNRIHLNALKERPLYASRV